MTKIKVLIEGYAKQIKGGWRASSTVILIKIKGRNIIVDPGCNKGKLIVALGKEKIKIENIDFVLLTHNHLDHSLLAGIFPTAKVITSEEIYVGDNQTAAGETIPGTDLKIIKTPGHAQEHCSLLVPIGKEIYAAAGDVFWWNDKEKQGVDIEKIDDAHPAETDMAQLIESRKTILKLADWIIPGHGKMFKTEKK